MTENAATTISGHGDHRYRAEHFKGLKPDHIAQIEAERAQQCRDLKAKREFEKMEEQQWAAQQSANTAHMMANEVAM